MRLDVALISRHPELSRRQARAAIEKGQVSVDAGTALDPGMDLATAAGVVWDPNRKALPRARCSLAILHLDESVLVVDKPAGLLSVPTAPGAPEDTALARVQDYVRHLHPHRPFVGLVHRLDKDTSGALAFALSAPARRALRAMFKEHRIERRYAALVLGEPKQERGEIALPIFDGYEGRRRIAGPGEPSRPALTRFTVVERFAGAAWLEVQLETGRQHQIRLHLSQIGLPILGDSVYGAPPRGRLPRLPRQMLHAGTLAFVHPLTGAQIRVESPLPDDFRAALGSLRQGSSRRAGATVISPRLATEGEHDGRRFARDRRPAAGPVRRGGRGRAAPKRSHRR